MPPVHTFLFCHTVMVRLLAAALRCLQNDLDSQVLFRIQSELICTSHAAAAAFRLKFALDTCCILLGQQKPDIMSRVLMNIKPTGGRQRASAIRMQSAAANGSLYMLSWRGAPPGTWRAASSSAKLVSFGCASIARLLPHMDSSF